MSYNQLRELHNNSFGCCTSIQLLYLQNNAIFEIESHTFYYLSSLHMLDLSFNVIYELPKNLPSSLKRLYIDDNPPLLKRDSPLLKISSLTSLEVLTASSNKLQTFPKFDGLIPNLVELNVTENAIKVVTPEDLAPLCQLKFLHVSGDRLFVEESQCDCHRFQKWTRDFGISVDSTVTCAKESKPALLSRLFRTLERRIIVILRATIINLVVAPNL